MSMKNFKKMFIYRKGMFVGQTVIHIILCLYCLTVILPLVLMFMVSISNEIDVIQYGYTFFPKRFSLDAYRYVFENDILRAYGVTISVTAVGTFLSILVCSMCAFAMYLPTVKYRNLISKYLYFPTLFNAGLIPWYLNITENLGMKDSFWVMIVPILVTPYNIFLIRNYYKSVPYSIVESASMDGASQFSIYFKMMLPLSGPMIATVCLFISLGYWNDWYLANWFIQSKELFPLQYYLYRIQSVFSSNSMGNVANKPIETGMVAGMFVTIGPIVLLYPFIQKYFVKGITIGGVKG